jgi:Flp pilus assembly protein CpaB
MKTMTRPSLPRGQGPLSTRGGTVALAAIAALLAGAALLAFLRHYRHDLTDSTPQRVLVARSLIPKGTPGDLIASRHLYREVNLRKSQVEDGAITDPAALEQKAVSRDVYPGRPITTKDLARASDRVLNRLSGYDRAISVPVDAAHGMIGKIQAGDHVDVVGTFGTEGVGPDTALIVARNALVLSVPSKPKSAGVAGSGGQSATIRVGDDAAAQIAAAADGGKVWLVLRPTVGARSHSTDAVARALRSGKPVRAKVSVDATVRAGR